MGRKKTHRPTDHLGVPVLRSHLEASTVSRRQLSLRSEGGRERLGVTVGYSTTNKLISRMIRWITRGKVSHAWVAYWDSTLNLRMVMQAEAWGFETRPWMRWLQENKWVAEYVVDSSRAADALKALAKFLGSDYDWLSAAWVGLKRWFARWCARPMSSPTKLMCSEAQLRYLQFVGVELGSLNVETTSPMEAMSFVGALGWESLESPLREPE